MRQTRLVTICGAALAASPFLAWVAWEAPSGRLVPWALLRDHPALTAALGGDFAPALAQPLVLQLLVGSFLLGALCTVLGLLGWVPRLLVLLTGLLPVGLIVYFWFRARDQLAALGVPAPSGSLGEVAGWILATAGWGFWLWAVGAVLLLLMGLLESPDDY